MGLQLNKTVARVQSDVIEILSSCYFSFELLLTLEHTAAASRRRWQSAREIRGPYTALALYITNPRLKLILMGAHWNEQSSSPYLEYYSYCRVKEHKLKKSILFTAARNTNAED